MMKPKQTKAQQPMTIIANDPERLKGERKEIGGSQSDDWNETLVNQACNTLWLSQSDSETRAQQANGLVHALIGIAPQDELEGMMAAQLLAAHNASMECYRRAMFAQQSLDARREHLNQAGRLSRTSAILLEALNRHRGKGRQTIVVEHVDVHSGGQAVVGVVGNRGGGGSSEPKEQPHAKSITHAPESSMWSPNETRNKVPVSGDVERPVPNARRKVDRRTAG